MSGYLAGKLPGPLLEEVFFPEEVREPFRQNTRTFPGPVNNVTTTISFTIREFLAFDRFDNMFTRFLLHRPCFRQV